MQSGTLIRLQLDLRETEPISGLIWQAGAEPRAFRGWLGLCSTIERVIADADHGASGCRGRPESE